MIEISNRYRRVPLGDIIRDERQRTEVDTAGLRDSIALYGVIEPIIVNEEARGLVLIAGERRWRASKELGLPDIPVRFFKDLPLIERKIIEYEENLKRADLPWRDGARAIAELHRLYQQRDSEWTPGQTAKSLSVEPSHVSNCLRVVPLLDTPRFAEVPTFSSALGILARQVDRLVGDAMSDIMEVTTAVASPKIQANGQIEIQKPKAVTVDESVLCTDFLSWAPQYSGPKFNFIHCDFPYGIEVFSGPQSGYRTYDTYQDSAEVYWRLIRCLGENLDRIMAHSGHIMFWFSMDHYQATFEAFRRYAPSLALQAFPLYWLKTDNVGILPDPKRGPRRVIETALIGSREDRFVVRSVANAYGAPTDKTYHTSTKPEPVLRFFFQMFVDENSRVFDPTCGSGSALRAAESLGAAQVLGLEINPEHAQAAKSALKQFRILRSIK